MEIAVDSKLEATNTVSDETEETVKSSKKENVRKYCLTKFTMLTEMKRLAKYDRKVLECGSTFGHSPFYCFLQYLQFHHLQYS